MQSISDTFWLTAKVLLCLLILRALIAFSGYNPSIPLLDPIFFAVRDSLISLGNWGARMAGVRMGG